MIPQYGKLPWPFCAQHSGLTGTIEQSATQRSWTLDHEQKQAFTKVKNLLMWAPTPVYFELNCKTVVCCDASSYGLDVLYQVHDGELKTGILFAYSHTSRVQIYTNKKQFCLFECSLCMRKVLAFPCHKEEVKLTARGLYSVKDKLSEHEELSIRGSRIVIPNSYRQDILGRIHDGHQGIQKHGEQANQYV